MSAGDIRISALLREIDSFNARLDLLEETATREVAQAFERVRNQLQIEIDDLVDEITALREAGETIRPYKVTRLQQFRNMQAQAIRELTRLSETTRLISAVTQHQAITASLAHADAVLDILADDTTRALARRFSGITPQQVIQMVAALQEQTPLGRLISTFGQQGAAELKQALIKTVTLGDSPLKMAQALADALQISHTRAQTIMRTETLRAVRESTRAAYRQEEGIIKGWKWHTAKQANSCAACLAMDGRVFELNTPAPMHPSCRCKLLPVIGDGLDLQLETGDEWLRKQPVKVQQRVLGIEGQRAYAAGEVELRHFVKPYESEDWGLSLSDGGIGWAKQQASGNASGAVLSRTRNRPAASGGSGRVTTASSAGGDDDPVTIIQADNAGGFRIR